MAVFVTCACGRTWRSGDATMSPLPTFDHRQMEYHSKTGCCPRHLIDAVLAAHEATKKALEAVNPADKKALETAQQDVENAREALQRAVQARKNAEMERDRALAAFSEDKREIDRLKVLLSSTEADRDCQRAVKEDSQRQAAKWKEALDSRNSTTTNYMYDGKSAVQWASDHAVRVRELGEARRERDAQKEAAVYAHTAASNATNDAAAQHRCATIYHGPSQPQEHGARCHKPANHVHSTSIWERRHGNGVISWLDDEQKGKALYLK